MQQRKLVRVTQSILVTVATAALTTVALACPTPTDSASRYHLTDRMAAAIAAERAKVMGNPLDAPRTRLPSADCVGGFAAGYPCNNVDLAAILPMNAIGGGEGNDIWGWTDATTGREYAIMGRTSGTAFVDVTVPDVPVYLGNLPTQTNNSLWRDIKVFADHAFIVSEASGHGMQVFDLTQLRGLSGPPQLFAATVHYDGFGAAHNIAINEDSGFAYAVGTRNGDDGCAGGLHMVDISTPTAPQFAGCYAADGYTHDVQCVLYHGPDADYHDDVNPREICFAFNEDTLTIVDVTDKTSPQLVARRTYFGSGYTHQGWITDDFSYLLLDDEGDELDNGHNTRTYIFDIRDLNSPGLLSSYTATTAAIDHNLYIAGDFAFQANYRAGMRILDITDIAAGNLVEVGFFDVFPTDDSAQFNGSWSLYPYFPSGTVIVSGIEQGLVVLRPEALAAPFSVQSAAVSLDVCGAGSDSLTIDVGAADNYSGTVSLSVAGLPAGVTASFSPQVLAPPATSTLTVTAPGGSAGVYPITITGDDGKLSFDDGVALNLSDGVPGQAQVLLPADAATGISALQTLYWTPASDANSYDVEVATDAGFGNVIAALSGTLASEYSAPQGFAAGTTHHWRVTANNACGNTVSATGTFTTAADDCRVYASVDVPKSISPVSTTIVTSTLTANPQGVVLDVDVVNLAGTHTWISDLDIKLEGPTHEHEAAQSRHPERTTVQLLTQSCSNENNFDIAFDDEVEPGGWPCPPTDGNAYQPASPLSALDRERGDGTWTLTVTDHFDADGGSLNSWGVRICTTPESLLPDSDADGVSDNLDNCRFEANADQRDTNGDGFGNLCDADLNNDGIVNFGDLALLKAQWLVSGDIDADLDGNGVVNFGDLARMKARFLSAPGPGAL